MSKKLLITEKPSVAREFAKVLKINGANRNGYLEFLCLSFTPVSCSTSL